MLHFIEVGYVVNNFRFNLILHCVKQLTTIVILYNCFDKMIEYLQIKPQIYTSVLLTSIMSSYQATFTLAKKVETS